MDIKNIFTDEDAVSPVIGVILMVAITVILAAVIGTFVLGLGDQVQNNAPQASFSFDYDNSGADVTVTHDGGATFNTENTQDLSVQVDGTDIESAGGLTATDFSVGAGVSAGSTATAEGLSGGEDIRVVWTSPAGDNTATLAQSTAP